MWNSVSKYNFSRFWPPEKSVFELMTNLKFSFSESGPGSVHIPPKPIFLFKFSNFQGYPENAPNHILSSNSAGKILKMAIKSEPLGLCSWHFWHFGFSMWLLNGAYFKDFKIFDLAWIWRIWLELSRHYCIQYSSNELVSQWNARFNIQRKPRKCWGLLRDLSFGLFDHKKIPGLFQDFSKILAKFQDFSGLVGTMH